jgi:hypothetical protein
MRRSWLLIAVPLAVVAAVVPLTVATHRAPTAAAQAASEIPPSPILSYSPDKTVHAPISPPRLTRVPIRVPGFDSLTVSPQVPEAPPEWIRFTRESPYSGSRPCALDSLGPVLVLRHYLAEKQWTSLTAPDHKGPLLVRYEIIDAAAEQFPYPFPELPRQQPSPYLVTAILYWADLAPQDRAAPLATYRRLEIDASGRATTSVGSYGPTITRVRAEWMEYGVSPKEARWRELKGRRKVVAGEAGWVVDEKPRRQGEGVSHCGQNVDIVPVYDLSISRPTS